MLLRGTQRDYGRAEHPEHRQLCLCLKNITIQVTRMLLRGTQHYGRAEHPEHTIQVTRMLLRGTQHDYGRAEHPEHRPLCLSEKHHSTSDTHVTCLEAPNTNKDVLSAKSTDIAIDSGGVGTTRETQHWRVCTSALHHNQTPKTCGPGIVQLHI